jgi:hypothetical protein
MNTDSSSNNGAWQQLPELISLDNDLGRYMQLSFVRMVLTAHGLSADTGTPYKVPETQIENNLCLPQLR